MWLQAEVKSCTVFIIYSENKGMVVYKYSM